MASAAPALAMLAGNTAAARIAVDHDAPFPIAVRSGLTIGGRIADVELWNAEDFERARAEGFDLAVGEGAEWLAIPLGAFTLVVQFVASHEAVERLVEDGRDFGDALWGVAGLARNDAAWASFVPAAG